MPKRLNRGALARAIGAAMALLPLLLGAAPRAAAEVTRAFYTDVRILPDSHLDVVETIVHDFQDTPRHGIYRTIPVDYTRHGATYSIGLKVVNVTLNGHAVPVKTTREGSDIRIRIGDPNTTLTGEQTYRLHYSVSQAVNYFNGNRRTRPGNGEPEVYWNATPPNWPFPISEAVARFFPPSGVAVTSLRTTSFVGRFGAQTPARVSTSPQAVSFRATNLLPQESLTFAVRLPRGSVHPSVSDQLYSMFGSWLMILLFPFLAAALLANRWWNHGRDEDPVGPTAVEWEPPKGLSPAEVGTLMDESCDLDDIVSTLIDLAARGYLTIEMQQTEKFFFFKNRDYIFTKTVPPKDAPPLEQHESLFYSGLFASGDVVSLSDLKNKFYTHLPGIRSAIYDELTRKGLFENNPEKTRQLYIGIGIVLAVLGGAALALMDGQMMPLWLGLIAAGVIVLLFARAMPAKTAAGSKALWEARGFQRFVRLAEKPRIEMLAKDDPTIFGRLLPYAIVLGVGDAWADKFQDLLREPPSWFVGPGYGYGQPFSSHAFINDLGSGMQTMGSTFASSPSSAGSGGSGFSGGGGGGGFGGGGGGSW